MAADPADDGLTLEQVLERQAGVVRPYDVHRWLSLDELRREVAEGRWRKPHRSVFVAHNRALTVEQERWVCLLCAPRGSALAGLTAAEIDGLEGFAVRDNHLVIPRGYRKPRRGGLIAHYADELTSADVHPAHLPRRTRLPRSLVDAAAWSLSDRRARAIILAGVQQRLVRPDDLRDTLARREDRTHHALIRESIDDAEGGIASVPERDFAVIVRQHGLPEPDRQVAVKRADGRYYLDTHWSQFGLSAEVHGIQHLAVATWDSDLDRHTELAASGRSVLQFSSYAVRHRSQYVGETLARAMRNRGWRH
ncbi:MAG: hypothetical protein ACOC96_01075 [Actinomycetota bacterium]